MSEARDALRRRYVEAENENIEIKATLDGLERQFVDVLCDYFSAKPEADRIQRQEACPYPIRLAMKYVSTACLIARALDRDRRDARAQALSELAEMDAPLIGEPTK